jgi:hypothetical protein
MSQVDEASDTTRAQPPSGAQPSVPRLGAMVTSPSKARVVRAAAVQISPDFVNHDGTINKVLDAIDEAAGQGAELIVFPGNPRSVLSILCSPAGARATEG